MEKKIEINVEDYVELRKESERYENILKLLMNNARLNADKTELWVSDTDEIMTYLSIVEETIYNNRLEELQKAETGDANE